MQKPLIIVSSRTGNTRILAHAAADALRAPLVSADALPDDLTPFNPVILAFWCDKGRAPDDMIEAARRLEGKDVGCLVTMGADPASDFGRDFLEQAPRLLCGSSNTLRMTFGCRGRISQAVFDRLTAMLGGVVTPERQANKLASDSHPDRQDVEDAVGAVLEAFAR
jgi:flavodoxin